MLPPVAVGLELFGGEVPDESCRVGEGESGSHFVWREGCRALVFAVEVGACDGGAVGLAVGLVEEVSEAT